MKRIFIPIIIFLGKRIERKRFTSPPIYIGGCGRSGTTLLLSILSSHKEIFACPSELDLYDRAGFKGAELVTPKFYRLYRTFLSGRIKSTANRFCEKSPSNIRNIELINAKNGGNFKFIQIIRDGRDVILSRHPKGKDTFWVNPERWISDVSLGLKYMEHPNVYTLKYEDLVTNFNETISGLCKFLGIPVSEEILHWHKYATVRQNNALFSSIQQINASSIGKWKRPENLDRVSQLTNNTAASELLKKMNYI